MPDRFAEMGGIPVNDDGGEEAEAGHAVVLALAAAVEPGRALACAPNASSEHVPSLRYPFIPPRAALSVRGPSIPRSTGATALSVRFCPYRNRPAPLSLSMDVDIFTIFHPISDAALVWSWNHQHP